MKSVGRVKVKCTGCGVEIEKYPQQVEQNKTGRFFCSAACRKGIGTKPRRKTDRVCEQCGGCFYPRHTGAPGRFCSKKCYDLWQRRHRVERTCETCGIKFDVAPAYEARQPARFCSRPCEAQARIKRPLDRERNGRPAVLDNQGYVRVYEPDHPRATRAGWCHEHRLVVERKIGRYLRTDEHVHHINGQKDDNRSENLLILSHSAHSLVTWNDRQAEVDAMRAELAEYRRRFGPL